MKKHFILPKSCFVLAVGTFFCAVVLPQAKAQFGFIDQNTTTWSSNACAPTATANALVYLDNANGDSIPNLFVGDSVLDTANQLGINMSTSATEGTDPADRDSGLATYLTAQHTTAYIIGGQAPAALDVTTANVLKQSPTAAYMETALEHTNAVIFGQYWGSQAEVQATASTFGNTDNGGHVLTLIGMDGTTNGSITFEDPNGPNFVENLSWTMVNGFIFVTGDPVQPADDGVDEGEGQGGSAYNSFAISDDLVVAVPEPSTGLLLGAALLVPAGRRFFRCR